MGSSVFKEADNLASLKQTVARNRLFLLRITAVRHFALPGTFVMAALLLVQGCASMCCGSSGDGTTRPPALIVLQFGLFALNVRGARKTEE
jgi:hypothetical protein